MPTGIWVRVAALGARVSFAEMVLGAWSLTAQEIVERAVGSLCWRAKRGFATFLTFDFGDRVPGRVRDHGEWHLWVYAGDWKLCGPKGSLATDQDDQAVIEEAIRPFNDKRLTRARVDPLTLKATFAFEQGLELDVGPNSDEETSDCDWWLLYTPEDRVLVVGPGSSWSYTSSKEGRVSRDLGGGRHVSG